jgi:ornithine cyclodeaminase/alanine dehydrogenase-like protein (mu-crystallin family)
MPLALEAVTDCFRRLAAGTAEVQPRRRLRFGEKGLLHYMAACDAHAGYFGMKIYTTGPQGARFLIPLYRVETAELVALIEADYLGQMRTGAASGVATRAMARANARTVAVIGTGLQARTQVEAVVHAIKVERVRAFGRDAARRENFAKEMTSKLGVEVVPVNSAEEAVRGADVVIAMTSSVKPVIEGRWLEPGMHINGAGANFAHKAELDADAVNRCDVIAADSVAQAKMEAGDLIQAFGEDAARWGKVREFSEVIAGKAAGRGDARQITLFKSIGIASEDVATAARVYEMAREKGIGRETPMWQR